MLSKKAKLMGFLLLGMLIIGGLTSNITLADRNSGNTGLGDNSRSSHGDMEGRASNSSSEAGVTGSMRNSGSRSDLPDSVGGRKSPGNSTYSARNAGHAVEPRNHAECVESKMKLEALYKDKKIDKTTYNAKMERINELLKQYK